MSQYADLIERLRGLLEKATLGPWDVDSEYDADGLASGGGGCVSGWHNYFVGAEIDGKWRTLLDTVNSDHKLIEDDRDEDGGRAWDAIGHDNANLVAAAITALPTLLAAIASLEAERDGLERRTAVRCLEITRQVRDGFLSEQYAAGQPSSSFSERFACGQVAAAIEHEFALGDDDEAAALQTKATPQ